jgi:hemoglobin-like flavoprotein
VSVSADADVIQRSLQLLAAHRNELAAHFYGRLFGRHPELEAYFDDSKHDWLERKFTAALRSIMQAAASPAEFERQLGSLRQTHGSRSVDPRYFALFGDVLIESLAYYGGRGWSEEVEQAWRSVLDTVVEAMNASHSAVNDSNDAMIGFATA